jgi:hypothetical protein
MCWLIGGGIAFLIFWAACVIFTMWLYAQETKRSCEEEETHHEEARRDPE